MESTMLTEDSIEFVVDAIRIALSGWEPPGAGLAWARGRHNALRKELVFLDGVMESLRSPSKKEALEKVRQRAGQLEIRVRLFADVLGKR